MSAAARQKAEERIKFEQGPIVSMETVERPTSQRHKWDVEVPVQGILDTVKSGKAVKLAFRTAEEMLRVQNALRHGVRKHGMQMRYMKAAKDQIICYAEKVASKGGEPT